MCEASVKLFWLHVHTCMCSVSYFPQHPALNDPRKVLSKAVFPSYFKPIIFHCREWQAN